MRLLSTVLFLLAAGVVAGQSAGEDVLAPLRARLDAGDAGGARAVLEELLADGVAPLLGELAPEQATQLVVELDRICDRAGASELQVTVREFRLARALEAHAEGHEVVLEAKRLLGSARYRVGDYAGAEELLDAVHTAREALPPGDSRALTAKVDLAAVRFALGDHAGALALEEAVLATREKILPPDHDDLLRTKLSLGATYHTVGDLERARRLFEQVLAVWDGTRPPEDSELLYTKSNLALVLRAGGELDEAHRLFAEVHGIWDRTLPADHFDLLRAKSNLAVTTKLRGDLEGALAMEEAVDVAWARLLPADHPSVLSNRMNLAATRYELGDFEGAYALLEVVYDALERLVPPGHPDLLRARQSLGATRLALRDVEGADELFAQVARAREAAFPADHPELLEIKANLASTRKQLGDVEGALRLEREVLAAREAQAPRDQRQWRRALVNLAMTLGESGDLERALSMMREVHGALLEEVPEDHPDLLDARQNLVALSYRAGQVEAAGAVALDLVRSLPGPLERALGASPRDARATARSVLQRLASVRTPEVSRDPDFEAACFDVLETARYVAGSPLYTRLAGLRVEVAERARERLARAEAELDRLVVEAPPQDPTEADRWRQGLRAAALERDRSVRALYAELGEDVVGRVTPARVAAALPPGHAAIGITKLPAYDWNASESVQPAGPRYIAQVLLARGRPTLVDLGPARDLEKLVADWRSSLGKETGSLLRGAGVATRAATSEPATGRALRAALVDPLLAHLGEETGVSTVHLCLDDALFTVPFEALPLPRDAAVPEAPDGDTARLGDLVRVRYELSMARLLEGPRPAVGEPSVLAVGSVAYGAVLDAADLSDTRPLPASASPHGERVSSWGMWAELPATEQEIAGLADQARRLLQIDADVLRGESVTEEALARAVLGVRYVHIATHGWFLPETLRSLLDHEPVGEDGVLGNRATVAGFAPLTLCGLVLSGANAVEDPVARSRHLLTAQEMSAFDLGACDLAVLSACETNVGIHRAGQGIQSLQAAVHLAGARSSITSLWSVQDWPTQSLMQRFYEGLWGAKLGKAAALWQAKCALREEGHPPGVWAGWVLVGDPN